MGNIAELFWISLLAWVWAEGSALFRVAILKTLSDKNFNYQSDRSYLFYKWISQVSLNIAGLIGIFIILISFCNILGGALWGTGY